MTTKTAVFKTNYGTFEILLDTEKAPITTANFIKLAESGFYDGTRFHRVIPNFMIQGGDPLTKNLSLASRWGTGDPGYKIKDEFHKDLKNVRGTISMANAGPNTGGSQFFINVADNSFLNNKHAVFGTVTKGMDIVDSISEVETSRQPQDRPLEDVIVEKVSIS
ncbi:peptidylprolyl isomerase [Candidatus Woesearchaeota archaeon]|nr:peptidylprolyl isomerase [Candidatus Woesearchaeota archaeon]